MKRQIFCLISGVVILVNDINIFFLSSDNINGQTGAAKFARLLLTMPDMWEKRDLVLRCFSNSDTFDDPTEYSKSITFKVKQFIRKILEKTYTGRKIKFFNYQINTLGSAPVLKMGPLLNERTIVILNDILVAWNFYDKYKNRYKSIFIMHNSGDLLSMLHREMNDIKIRDFLLKCESAILNYATQLVFVSEVARKNFVAMHPEHAKKTTTIYIGMNYSKLRVIKDDDIVRFVTVGTVCERKNQILAIKAVEKLKNENITMTIVGDGPLLDDCKKYVRNHGLDNIISFTGATNNVESILINNNVFIMTSTDEGLPVAAQEAMSVGMPLIMTDVGGCSELIDGNGFLIKPNLEEVVKTMKFFIDNREKISTYGEKSLEKFHHTFSLEKMHKKYIDIVNNMMK